MTHQTPLSSLLQADQNPKSWQICIHFEGYDIKIPRRRWCFDLDLDANLGGKFCWKLNCLSIIKIKIKIRIRISVIKIKIIGSLIIFEVLWIVFDPLFEGREEKKFDQILLFFAGKNIWLILIFLILYPIYLI